MVKIFINFLSEYIRGFDITRGKHKPIMLAVFIDCYFQGRWENSPEGQMDKVYCFYCAQIQLQIHHVPAKMPFSWEKLNVCINIPNRLGDSHLIQLTFFVTHFQITLE